MAIKTFTTGEVLTAADTNTYLGNSGMVFVKQQTIGSAVASVTVTSCFSADYDNYKIIFSGFAGSANGAAAYLKLNNSTGSTYYGNMIYNLGTTSAIGGVSAANGTSNGFFAHTISSTGTMTIDGTINAPFLAVTSNFVGNYSGRNYNGQFSTHDSNAASSTGFTFAPSGGTITGGTITVYGFRKE